MAILSFTLSEEGVAVLHDALACIVKFSDDVCLEARKDQLTLTALNLSKSAYVCVTFASNRFFSRFNFEGTGQFHEKFFCQLYIRVCMPSCARCDTMTEAGHSHYCPYSGPELQVGSKTGIETRRPPSSVARSRLMTGLVSRVV